MQPPAFSTVPATSAAAPEGSLNRHSAGASPFGPGFALRGRFFGGARFTIQGPHSSLAISFADHGDYSRALARANIVPQVEDRLPRTQKSPPMFLHAIAMADILGTRRIALGSATSTTVVIQSRIMAQEFLGLPPSRPTKPGRY